MLRVCSELSNSFKFCFLKYAKFSLNESATVGAESNYFEKKKTMARKA